jgi:hypothetical protein
VSRANKRPKATVWPIRLRKRLPVFPVPLRPEDPDAKVDIQDILNAVYDRAAYDLTIDYHSDAVPPLADEQASWADALLREKGLR